MGFLDAVKTKIMAAAGWAGAYGETVGWSTDRGHIMYYLPGDSRQYLDNWTRREIHRKVEWLTQTFTVVDQGLKHMANITNGEHGISMQQNSDDEDWNELALADWEQYASSASRFDVAGRRSFYEIGEDAVYHRIKVGEFFASMTSNPRWDNAPCVQLWDSIEICNPDEKYSNGRKVIDGVDVDRFTAPIGYWVRTADGKFEMIPASEMIHWYKPLHVNDTRGVSELATAVNPLVDTDELIKITTKTAKQNTALGLHIKKMVKAGGQGALDRIQSLSGKKTGGPTTQADQTVDPKYEKLVGGGAIIYTAEDGDAKMLTPQSPTPLLEPFITKVLMRNALTSLGAPSEFFWALESLNGVAQRVVLLKTDLITHKLGSDFVSRFADPVATRYLLHRIATGKLRKCKDPNWLLKMSWQLPGRLSIDNGRDGATEISQLGQGIETLQGINDRRGRNWRKQIRQWFLEWKYAQEVSEELKVPWALPFWRASMPGAVGGKPEDKVQEGELEPGEIDPKKKNEDE